MSKDIAKARAKWRSSIKSKVTYQRAEYIRRIQVHAATLRKYLGEFHKYLAVWTVRHQGNADLARSVFGHARVDAILAGGEPTVAEVFALFKAKDLRHEFAEYLIGKTHLSYEIDPAQPKPTTDRGPDYTGPMYPKLAEFVFLILAEYTIIHNYCFVSKLRHADMKTVDSWMEPISGQPERKAPRKRPRRPQRRKAPGDMKSGAGQSIRSASGRRRPNTREIMRDLGFQDRK